jgi:hypothetical protein
LLTEHINALRAAFRETRQDHPFTIEASREMMGIASLHPSYELIFSIGSSTVFWAGRVRFFTETLDGNGLPDSRPGWMRFGCDIWVVAAKRLSIR